MDRSADEVLDQEVEAIKQQVDVLEHDIEALIAAEEESAAREELLEWLAEKHERQQLLRDEERVEDLLAHVEDAYRKAAISQDTYTQVKQRTQELLG